MSRYILHLPCAYSPESHASHTSPMSELTNCFTGLNAFHTGDTPRRCLDLSNLSCGSPAAPAEGSPQRDMASPHLGTTDPPALRNSRMKNCWSFSPRLLCSSPKLPPSDPHESNKENESQFGRSQRSQSKLGWFLPSLESQPEVDRVPCPLGSPVHSLPLVPSLSFHGDADGSMEEFEQDDKEGSFANSMSCSMAQLLSEPLMNQEVNLPLISIARQKGRRLFRCPSMPERLGSLERPAAKRTSTSPAAGSQPLKRLCTVPSISEEVLKGEDDQETVAPIQRRHPLQKTHSLCGLGQQLRDGVNAEVIGDFSKICALPTVTGRHQELKYITGKTMCALLDGRFKSLIESVVIVDCRYPYEYLGGHIKGAQNHPNTDEAVDFLLSKKLKASSPNKRLVLVLHCEFSSERAPQTCRLLRSEDRSANEYPALHYPELYVLKGGYRDFFQAHPEYCEPRSYCPMHHQDHREELLRCRTLSRTSADERRRRHLIHRLVKQ